MEDPNADHDHMEIDSFTIKDDADVISVSRCFPKIIETQLQKDWPMVDSTLKEYGISCELDLINSSMAFSTTSTKDPDIIDKAKDLLQLFSLTVPASKAMKIFRRRKWEIIKFGCQKDGVCTKYGISKEQFLFERRKLLYDQSLKVIADMICSDIHIVGEILVVLGPTTSVKWIRQIVEECMSRAIHPSRRIEFIKETLMLYREGQRLEALRL